MGNKLDNILNKLVYWINFQEWIKNQVQKGRIGKLKIFKRLKGFMEGLRLFIIKK